MDELRRIAKKYYQNTVSFKYFGVEGFVYILLSMPFIYLSYKANFVWHLDLLSFISLFVFAGVWLKAKKQYDKNLVVHLSYYTHLESRDVAKHKAIYLKLLTIHVSDSLYKSMGIFNGIINTHRNNKSFVIENFGFHLSNFIYNPEAKSRILSLVIYFISFMVLLVVVKSDIELNVFSIISGLSFDGMLTFMGTATFIVMFGYVMFVFPCMLLVSYFIVPIMLKLSSVDVLNRFFIAELNKYSYSESIDCK